MVHAAAGAPAVDPLTWRQECLASHSPRRCRDGSLYLPGRPRAGRDRGGRGPCGTAATHPAGKGGSRPGCAAARSSVLEVLGEIEATLERKRRRLDTLNSRLRTTRTRSGQGGAGGRRSLGRFRKKQHRPGRPGAGALQVATGGNPFRAAQRGVLGARVDAAEAAPGDDHGPGPRAHPQAFTKTFAGAGTFGREWKPGGASLSEERDAVAALRGRFDRGTREPAADPPRSATGAGSSDTGIGGTGAGRPPSSRASSPAPKKKGGNRPWNGRRPLPRPAAASSSRWRAGSSAASASTSTRT